MEEKNEIIELEEQPTNTCVVSNKKKPWAENKIPCFKFIVMSLLSVGTTVLASYLLISDGFKNTATTSFSVGLITSNLAFWCEPPKSYDSKKT